MEALVAGWNDARAVEPYPMQGLIALCLDDENYFLSIENHRLNLLTQTTHPADLTVIATFDDWVALLSGHLPVAWALLSGRLRWKGKIAYLRQLPRMDFAAYLCEDEDRPDDFEIHPVRHWHLPQRVLIINASPRKENGYTFLLSEALRKGLQQVVEEVECIQLEDFRLEPCCGCWYCWGQGEGKCRFDARDDGRQLLDRMAAADLLVFAFPLYSDGMPSGLKKLLDRRIATLQSRIVTGRGKTRHPRRIPKRQAIALLSVCGFVEKVHFQAVKAHFRALAHNWHTPLVGEIYRSAAMTLFRHPLLYTVQCDILAAVEKAGMELARHGNISRRTKRRIERDFISVPAFKASANYFWKKK